MGSTVGVAYCAGCCCALFVVLIAVGVMNLAAMVVLAAVVPLEKLCPEESRSLASSAFSPSFSRSP